MRRFIVAALLCSSLVLSSQAMAQQGSQYVAAGSGMTQVDVTPINDPLEPFNRAVFGFNHYVDAIVLNPVTTVYKAVFPQFIRNSISAFLANLGSPVVMLNEALQGNWVGFENTTHRFVTNTIMGGAGLYDIASHIGVPEKPEAHGDFGQTLGVWGVGHGAYLVLPIIGPSSTRDGTGRVVDYFADPYNEAFMWGNTQWPIYARGGAVIVDNSAKYGDQYHEIMHTAVDPYVTFRSIYTQRRAYLVQGGKAPSTDVYSSEEAKDNN